MPSRFIVKEFEDGAYYHVFNRGVNKRPIFLDEWDFSYFLKILQRYLDPHIDEKSSQGLPYKKYNDDIELLCYCLMKNHIHLLIRQKSDGDSIARFMRSISTTYVMYFNKKYQRVGPLFQSVYKASRISDDSYLQHITRYIHMNPKDYLSYRWSSLPTYIGTTSLSWLNPKPIILLFEGESYLDFLKDYEKEKDDIEDIKHELADQ